MATYLTKERTEKDIKKMMGKRIKDLRIRKNWTQDDLAEKLGFEDKSAISRFENGIVFPKTEILIRLADALECDINYLLKADKGKTPAISTLMRLTGLTENNIEYLMHLKKDEFDDELKTINSVLEYNRLNEILSAIIGYKMNRDRVSGSSRKPPYHATLFEEYTRYRVQPAYRQVFVAEMVKALKVDKGIIMELEEKLSPHSYNFEVFREVETKGLTAAQKKMVKDFYYYEEALFREYELTARELQIHRLFMNYLELY